ncbi:MAG: transposase [Tannerella sp.]|nr:transposase [Tannerella sp.]
MKYVYDAVGEVRKRIVRELQSSLSKRQMPQCEEGRKLLAQTTD